MSKQANKVNVDMVDAMQKVLISSVGLATTFTGLHNAFKHGHILDENGIDFTSEDLSALFDHLEGLCKISRRLSSV